MAGAACAAGVAPVSSMVMFTEPAAVVSDRPVHRGLQAATAVAGMEVYVPGALANVRSACAVMEKAERGWLVSWKVRAPGVFLAARRVWFPLPRRAAPGISTPGAVVERTV